MKTIFPLKKFIFTLFSSLLIALPLTAYSVDKPKLSKAETVQQFAAQCIERETKNSINKDNDRQRFEKPCLCIATRMMKGLTAIEAEKLLVEQKNTQSLRISFDEAAYFCLQEKPKPKSPQLFGRK